MKIPRTNISESRIEQLNYIYGLKIELISLEKTGLELYFKINKLKENNTNNSKKNKDKIEKLEEKRRNIQSKHEIIKRKIDILYYSDNFIEKLEVQNDKNGEMSELIEFYKNILINLIETGKIELAKNSNGDELTENFINNQIKSYLLDKTDGEGNNKEKLLDFLGKKGKVMIVMNSAEKFANKIIKKLGIDFNKIEKIKISTYINGESTVKELDEKTKENLIEQFDLKELEKGEKRKILILEDMIDSGNTLNLLNDFLSEYNYEAQVLCLFDKEIEKAEEIKTKLNSGKNKIKKLDSIIKIPKDFIIGGHIDYDGRTASGFKDIYKVLNINYFTRIMNVILKKSKRLQK